jgi:NADPH-dependent 2,4-dienoyl-CoA reductase/sulfur reductase-like enzyme/nitrite reductase/ring-hydroxylating ferredoxin subunit
MKTKEVMVLKKNDLKDGEMKKVQADDQEILLVRLNSKFYAHGAYCTHYGASLEEGSLAEERIVCPWHHACFQAQNGNLVEPPARDALPSFPVKIKDDAVYVDLPEEIDLHRLPDMVSADREKDTRIFAILGAGAVGNAAAQALREAGYQGRIVLISRESRLPYDRPNLSKDYLAGKAEAEWMPLRTEEFYENLGIELKLGKSVDSVNIPTKTVKFSDDETLIYDRLLLATGGIPRSLPADGSDLKNIYLLRSYDDADEIIASLKKDSKIVVIGSSFIGMETANSFREKDLEVSVVSMDNVPFENVLGEEIGKLFQKSHENNNVKFYLNNAIQKFTGNGKVEEVVLKDGTTLPADLVVVGIGVRPATDQIQGLDLSPDGGVAVDRHFRAAEDVFAAGDIARFPFWLTGEKIRIEHWRTAEQTGRVAALNMAGQATEYRDIPFFWTNQAGIYFRYVGHATEWDGIIVTGNIESKNFLVFYIKNDMVMAISGCGKDKEMTTLHELMRLKKLPSSDDLKNGNFQ